jgi:hypothetical protein
MINAVRCVSLVAVVSSMLGGIAAATASAQATEGAAQPRSVLQSRSRAGDLTLEVPDPATAVTFGHREVAEDSCEIFEGCALGAGRRAQMQIHVIVRNAGRRAVDLGYPWESPFFNPSLCQQANTIYGFIWAELRDSAGKLVASGSLSSSCIADRAGGFTCMAQGLGVGASAPQPRGQCDYLDVTGLGAGQYRLRLTVNPSGEIPESDRSNNSIEVMVDYPPGAGEQCAGPCDPEGVA